MSNFVPIPCLGFQNNGPDNYDYDCEYYPGFFCEDCILNGGNYDPRTGKKFIGKHKGHLKKYKRAAYERFKGQSAEPIGLTLKEGTDV